MHGLAAHVVSLNATSHSHLIDLEKFWIALVVRHLFSSFASGAPGRRGEGWWYQALTCIFSRLVCLSLPAASCLQLTADQICPLFACQSLCWVSMPGNETAYVSRRGACASVLAVIHLTSYCVLLFKCLPNYLIPRLPCPVAK